MREDFVKKDMKIKATDMKYKGKFTYLYLEVQALIHANNTYDSQDVLGINFVSIFTNVLLKSLPKPPEAAWS